MPQRNYVSTKRGPEYRVTWTALWCAKKGDADGCRSEKPGGVHAGKGCGSGFLGAAVQSVMGGLRLEISAHGGT